MPEYVYICDKCSLEFSVIKSIKNYKPQERCPSCKNKDTHRNYEGMKIFGSIPKTLGHFMDLNGDRLSEDEKQQIKEKARKENG